MKILRANTSEPVEHAKVYFYRYNPQTRLYDLINEHTFLPQNPMYSNAQGVVTPILPDGTYKVEVHALGYVTQEVEFAISAITQQEYPTIHLVPTAVTVLDWIRYQAETLTDFVGSLWEDALFRSQSSRFRSLTEIVSLGLFAVLTAASLVARTKMTPLQLLSYLKMHIQHFLTKTPEKYIFQGSIYDAASGLPVANAVVILFEQVTQRELTQLYSNPQGVVYVQLDQPVEYLISAPGYVPQEGVLTPDEDGYARLHVKLEAQSTLPEKVEREFHVVIGNLFGFLFEALVLSSFIFEILFIKHLGFVRVAPFFLLSCLNVIIWFTYVSSSQRLLKH